MLTSALISLANSEVPDWSRVRILTFLDEIQKMVFKQNATAQMRMYDSTKGLDPLLTTDGTKVEYNISKTNGFPYDAWRVYMVYNTIYAGHDYYKHPEPQALKNILTFDATPATPYARVVFHEKPTGSFYIRCYRSPTTLDKESVQLEVPEAYHLTHIYEGLMGFIEQFRSGKSERYQIFIQKLLPDLIKRMSDGQRRNKDTRYRSCGV